MQSRSVQVGVGAVILRGSHVLLGLRKGAHGAGTWAFPGGHLEFGESPESCAVREALEETGLHVTPLQRAGSTSNVFTAEGLHFITLFVVASCPNGQPAVLEPHKCGRWEWFAWQALPQPLFSPVASLVGSGFRPEAAA
ncbi:MAG: NUDIX domain-containing protein [Piscinibacter sp.]|uniref:nucleotide triphosphate diphosphatase NUDT15 n=1 Tax=Piscinibacter sp. TaxID=1903157 RepID=UPI000FDE9666|nr:NUDIX hydrolase [Piscinibacter sp.]MCW5664633.1 NUDIX domain-containing protein [Piscinibacter sp.]